MEQTRGEWLVRQMERRGIGVRQVADALEVTTQTVYGWQNSKTVINEDRVPRLAETLGISVIEARRGLGLWVPDGVETTLEVDELEAAEKILEAALVEVRRRKEEREVSSSNVTTDTPEVSSRRATGDSTE